MSEHPEIRVPSAKESFNLTEQSLDPAFITLIQDVIASIEVMAKKGHYEITRDICHLSETRQKVFQELFEAFGYKVNIKPSYTGGMVFANISWSVPGEVDIEKAKQFIDTRKICHTSNQTTD